MAPIHFCCCGFGIEDAVADDVANDDEYKKKLRIYAKLMAEPRAESGVRRTSMSKAISVFFPLACSLRHLTYDSVQSLSSAPEPGPTNGHCRSFVNSHQEKTLFFCFGSLRTSSQHCPELKTKSAQSQ